jgi:UDPglucose--hexose-1-phosphate uridylyltransferase
MAPERKGRPGDFICRADDHVATGQKCPFCKGNETLTPREIMSVKDNDEWLLRVFPNKYPALRVENSLKREGKGLYDIVSGVGAHEVIVFTPEHTLAMNQYTPVMLQRLFTAVRDRMVDLNRDIRLAYIQFFQNKGFYAGATIAHPHGQLLALPIIPDIMEREYTSAKEHYMAHKRCLLCDIIAEERAERSRVVYESYDYIAFCPFASAFPFELRIYPKTHSHDFASTPDMLLAQLGEVMAEVFRRMSNVLADPDYQMALHTSPTVSAINDDVMMNKMSLYYHWHIEIYPRISRVGSGEQGAGFRINTVLPEEAAELLREMLA